MDFYTLFQRSLPGLNLLIHDFGHKFKRTVTINNSMNYVYMGILEFSDFIVLRYINPCVHVFREHDTIKTTYLFMCWNNYLGYKGKLCRLKGFAIY